MGKDPDELREEIDETRDRMGDTVDAIAYKTNVRARVGDAIRGTVNKMGEMMPDMTDVQDRALGAADSAMSAAGALRQNPLGLLFGMAAIGFLLGSLLPTTSIERERLGPIGDQLKEQAQERVQEALGTAREVAAQAVSQAVTGTVGETATPAV